MFGKRKSEAKDDRSVIEISNDSGDHYVADVPTNAVRGIEKELRKAGVEKDNDEELKRNYHADKIAARRDSEQYRYRSERVIDEQEDMEDSHDREADYSDYEPGVDSEPEAEEASEQRVSWFG